MNKKEILKTIGLKKWSEKSMEKLLESIEKYFDVHKSCLYFWFPYIDYFCKEKSSEYIFNNRYHVHQFINEKDILDDNNYLFESLIDFEGLKLTRDIVVKRMHLLSFTEYYDTKYYLKSEDKLDFFLPNYHHDTIKKLYSFENSNYIDTFVSYLVSILREMNISPCFPYFYGYTMFFEDNTKIEITDEYEELENTDWYKKNKKKFNIYTLSDPFQITNSDTSINADNSSGDTIFSSNDSETKDKIYAIVSNFPVQLKFTEYCGTDKREDTIYYDTNVWRSILFQIIFSLSCAQYYFNLTHNDLHLGNILFKPTKKVFLYFQYNNTYFKVPTFGYIVKIIDWNRSTFRLKDMDFYNNCFRSSGTCFKQFMQPIHKIDSLDNTVPCFSGDLSLLACNIIKEKTMNKQSSLYPMIKKWVINVKGEDISEKYTGFDCNIQSMNCIYAVPEKQLNNYNFSKYIIDKPKTNLENIYILRTNIDY